MLTFKDNKGDTWKIDINYGACKRVQELAKVRLTDLDKGEPPLMVQLQTDYAVLCDVIYSLCAPQATDRGIDDVGFAERLGGQAIADAAKAMWGELRNFFQSLGRTDIVTAVGKVQEMIEACAGLATEKMQKTNVAAEVRRIVGAAKEQSTPGTSTT